MKTRSSICAKAIKQELKKVYPAISFRVRAHNYADSDAVYVYYDMHENKNLGQCIKNLLKKYSDDRDYKKDWHGLAKVTCVLVMHDFA